MLSYVIVGSGYRSEYFARIAHTWPNLFRALYLCRSEEKVALMQAHTGIAGTTRPEEAIAFCPDFIVVCVDRGHVAEATLEWAGRGFPVVCETPAGASMEELQKIWLCAQNGAKIVCCEQYHRHPLLMSGIEQIEMGTIGMPVSATISLVHDYHAASLMRRVLQTQGETYSVQGCRQESRVTATDSRYGAILDGSGQAEERDVVSIQFASGKCALYDFSHVQYRSFIRSRTLTVRGTRGEWHDTVMSYLDAKNQPCRLFLMPELPEVYRILDHQALGDLRKTWSPELFLSTVWDEYAIATILLDMGQYLDGGESPYPIEEALEDARFWLLLQEAVNKPNQTVTAGPVPWIG